MRRILCEFVLVRLQDLSNQARLDFDICSVGTEKDNTQRPVSVEECQVAEVPVLRQQDPVLRAGPREHLIVAYAGGDLGDVGYVVAFAPQTRNDLPLHTLVGEYPQASAVGSLAENPEYLAGEGKGYNRFRPGVLRRTMPLEPSLLGARRLGDGLE